MLLTSRIAMAVTVLLPGVPLSAQMTERCSLGSGGQAPNGPSTDASASEDGRFVVFQSTATNLAPDAPHSGTGLDVFVKDRSAGTVELVNASSSGTPGNGDAHQGRITPDGRFVIFRSEASNLVPGDTNGVFDVFVRDLTTHTTSRVSVSSSGAQGFVESRARSISNDGRFVLFDSSSSNLDPNDANGNTIDCFVHDRLLGTTSLADQNSAGVQGGGGCYNSRMSGDGRVVVFESVPGNFVVGGNPNVIQIFARDLVTGITEAVSVDANGVLGSSFSERAAVSRTGRYVAFVTMSALVPEDVNGIYDVYLRDRLLGTTIRVSAPLGGGADSDWLSTDPTFTSDGRYIGYASEATNIVVPDANGFAADVLIYQIATGTTERVGLTALSAQGGPLGISAPALADQGRIVFYHTPDAIVSSDADGQYDVYVRDRGPVFPVPTVYCTPKTNSIGCVPAIGSSGMPLASGADQFHVTCSNVLNHRTGLLFFGLAPGNASFAGGTLCLTGPLVRMPAQNSGGNPGADDCSGQYDLFVSQAFLASKGWGAGTSVFAQWFSRDNGFAEPDNLGLSAGLRFTVAH